MSASPPPKRAPRAVRTSDVERPRFLAIVAVGAAIGVALGIGTSAPTFRPERPIARPHAKLGCASCHEKDEEEASRASTAPPGPRKDVPWHAAAACVACHGPGHGSTRSAHRSLAARGELPCATCHGQHQGGQGVTFEGPSVVRWGAGARDTPNEVTLPPPRTSGVAPGAVANHTTVPLVPLAACSRCHDPTRSSDPIAACVPATVRGLGADAGADAWATTAAGCFDEHVTLGAVREGREARDAPCLGQHGASRFVAWDAAREIAATTPWVSRPPKRGVPWAPLALALVGATLAATVQTMAARRERKTEARAPVAPAARKRLPVIDTSTCLGCYACVDACPFDVLAIEKYVAVVARPDECCGVVVCEQVCPNGSLRVADGAVVLDQPRTNDLESVDVPGLYLAGDLTGLPLIKNAIRQGVHAVDRIAQALPRRRADLLDVLVVGAGPAGLSAALRAKEKGLRCVVLEQATIAASIKSFPRDKIVHDPPLDLPVEGELWLERATKEEVVAQWTRIVRSRAIDVREGHRVIDLMRQAGGDFVVTAETGDAGRVVHRAHRVVLAIGRRGTPRRIDLAIESGTEDRIAYALADARSFAGKRIVVVGLGDTAMEAAIALARQPGTTVVISYRGPRFARGKAKNIREVEALASQKKLKIHFETAPVALGAAGVTIEGTGVHKGRRILPADALLVLIGGEPAWDLLVRAGVERPRKEEPATSVEAS